MRKNGIEETLEQDLIQDIIDQIINSDLGEIFQEDTLGKNCEKFVAETEEFQLQCIGANIADCNLIDSSNNYELTADEIKRVNVLLLETCEKIITAEDSLFKAR